MTSPQDPWAGAETLYELVTPSVIRMAYFMTGDYATAEDVVHDAFVKVVARHKNLADTCGVAAYLRKAVVNEIRMSRRSWLSRLRRQERYARLQTNEDSAAFEAVVERDELVSALQELPETWRTVLVLTYLLDLSDQDIHNATGLAKGTIKSARHRGLAALRKDLTHDRVEQ